jgi:uncharacterized protein (DUF1330 family)
MSVYAVASIHIHDRDGYRNYEQGFMDTFSRYAGKLRAWYDSDEYQALARHRFEASQASIAVIQGFGGPSCTARSPRCTDC